MEEIMKIVKSIEYSGSLIKGVSKAIQNEAKEPKGGFLGMLLDTLGASLCGENTRVGYGSKGKGIIRASYGSKLDF